MTNQIPAHIESEYLKFQKLGFRKLWILFNNLKNEYQVSIVPKSWSKDEYWIEIVKTNE